MPKYNSIHEEEIVVRGIRYTKLTLENGEEILRRFDEKTKMWATLMFSKEDNTQKLNQLDNVCKSLRL